MNLDRRVSLLPLTITFVLSYISSFAPYPKNVRSLTAMSPPQGGSAKKMDGEQQAFNALKTDLSSSQKLPRAAVLSESLDTGTIVYGIRHGTSVSNEWMMEPGNEWGSPTYNDGQNTPDAPLSDTGMKQAAALARQLRDCEWLQSVELIVVSPLTRCLQTYSYGVKPVLEMISSTGSREHLIPVLVHPLLTERVYSVSETGRPAAGLKKDFPDDMLDWSLLPGIDCWWYDPSRLPSVYSSFFEEEEENVSSTLTNEWRPHGDGQIYCVVGEPMSVFTRRMDALKEWLMNRPEKRILAVGHWAVFRHFLGTEMDHCQVCTIKLK